MANPELGSKRLCASCGAKFYDLNKTPIACPKCGTPFEVVPVTTRPRPDKRAASREPEVEAEEVQGTELISLEEADAEAQGKQAEARGRERGASSWSIPHGRARIHTFRSPECFGRS